MSRKKDRDGEDAIKVVVRVRPYCGDEAKQGEECQLILKAPSEQTITVSEPGVNFQRGKSFDLDKVYWSFDEEHPCWATQRGIYADIGETMISDILSGLNSCVIAYGQAGSGKTYSILGDTADLRGEGMGLLPRVIDGLFEALSVPGRFTSWACTISFLEIHYDKGESLRDLLQHGTTELTLRMDPVTKAMQVQDLREEPVKSREEALAKLEEALGSTTRKWATRSHTIFSIKTSVKSKDGVVHSSQCKFVDLADATREGFEQRGGRLSTVEAPGAAKVNSSLTTLSRVIEALGTDVKAKQLPPYRESKLTQVLKENLGGNCRTVLLSTVSPCGIHFKETMNTLRFAKAAKNVKLRISANESQDEASSGGLSIEAVLREEISVLRQRLTAERFSRSILNAKLQREKREKELDGKSTTASTVAGSEATTPGSLGSDREDDLEGVLVVPEHAVLAYLGGQEPRIELGLRNFAVKDPTEDRALELSGQLAELQETIVEARSAFKLGRMSHALARLRPLVTVDVEDPLKVGLLVSFEPVGGTEDAPKEPESLSVQELHKRLAWLSTATDTDTGPLGLWLAARNATKRGSMLGGELRREHLEHAEREAQARREAARMHTDQIAELEVKLADAFNRLKEAEATNQKEVQNAKESCEAKNASQSQEIAKLKQLLTQASEAGMDLIQKNQQLLEEKAKLEAERMKLKDDVLTLQDQNEIWEKEVQELRHRIELIEGPVSGRRAAESDSEDEAQELFEEKEQLAQKIEEMDKVNKDLTRRLTLYQGGSFSGLDWPDGLPRVQEVDNTDDTDSSSSDSDLEEENKQLKETIEKHNEALDGLKAEYDEVVRENAELNRAAEDLEQRLQELLRTATQDFAYLQQDYDKLYEHSKELEKKVHNLEGQCTDLRQGRAFAEDKFRRMKSEVDKQPSVDDFISGKRSFLPHGSLGDELAGGRQSSDDESDGELTELDRLYKTGKDRKSVLQEACSRSGSILGGTPRLSLAAQDSVSRVRSNTVLADYLAKAQARLASEKSQRKAALEEQQAMSDRLNASEVEVEELRRMLEDAQEHVRELEAEKQDGGQGNGGQELKERCEALQRELGSFKIRVQDADAALAEAEERSRASAKRAEALQQELAAAKAREQEAKAALAECAQQGSNEEQTAALEALQRELEGFKVKSQNAAAALAEAEERCAATASQAEALQRELDDAHVKAKEAAAALEDLAERSRRVEELDAAAQALQRELDNCQGQQRDTIAALQEQTAQVEAVRLELEKCRAEAAEAAALADSERAESRASLEKLEAMQLELANSASRERQLAAELAQHSERSALLEDDSTATAEKLQALQRELDGSRAEVSAAEQRAEEQRAAAAAATEQRQAAARDLEALQLELANSASRERQLAAELAQHSERSALLEDDSAATAEKLQALQRELDGSRAEVSAAEQRAEEQRAVAAAAAEQRLVAARDLEALRGELDECRALAAEAASRADSREVEGSATLQKLEALEAELASRISKEGQLSEELQQHVQRISLLEGDSADATKKAEELQQKLTDCQARVAEALDRAERQAGDTANAQRRLEALTADVAAGRSREEALSAELAQRAERCAGLEDESAAATQKLEALQQELAEHASGSSALVRQSEASELQLRAELAEQRNALALREQTAKASAAALQQLQAKADEREALLQERSAALDALQQDMARREADIQQLTAELSSEGNRHSAQEEAIMTLRKELEDINKAADAYAKAQEGCRMHVERLKIAVKAAEDCRRKETSTESELMRSSHRVLEERMLAETAVQREAFRQESMAFKAQADERLKAELARMREASRTEMQTMRQQLGSVCLAADAAVEHAEEQFHRAITQYKSELCSQKALFCEQMKKAQEDHALIADLVKRDRHLQEAPAECQQKCKTAEEVARKAESRARELSNLLSSERSASQVVTTRLQTKCNEETVIARRLAAQHGALMQRTEQQDATIQGLRVRVSQLSSPRSLPTEPVAANQDPRWHGQPATAGGATPSGSGWDGESPESPARRSVVGLFSRLSSGSSPAP